jgi:hypothetical protein
MDHTLDDIYATGLVGRQVTLSDGSAVNYAHLDNSITLP